MQRREVRVSGTVQGVGFRPFVFALAQAHALTGHVGNDASGVFIEVQGEIDNLDAFLHDLETRPPRLASVTKVVTRIIPPIPDHEFTIVASRDSDERFVSIPPDTATCLECAQDISDPRNRRFRYPFTTCTHCGPRYTLVTGLPYDREQTTMAEFEMCVSCADEYNDPLDRRFHAQPIACASCGPAISYATTSSSRMITGDLGLAAALHLLENDGILAIKGIGGYHLACNADSPAAVQRLRERKQRGAKPFALMCGYTQVANDLAVFDDEGIRWLESPQSPIVLAAGRDRKIQESVAPRQDRLGIMLAYSPLHLLLFRPHPQRPGAWIPRVLVMTSGNLADEPICTTTVEARERLSDIADAFLDHNRGIHVSCDDSVVGATGEPLRRSRGFAPLPIQLAEPVLPILAVGGELKTTLCVARDESAWMSQHIGDTENLETLALLDRTANTLSELTRVVPELIVADAHPRYLSRRWAEDYAAARGVEFTTVQHHHAHLASLLAEHAWPAHEPVLGFAFDGTGYGSDGSIWGGEFLLGGYASVERVGHLRSIVLPGGDAAVKRPPRIALAHLLAASLSELHTPAHTAMDSQELRAVSSMLVSGAQCVPTTSIGRLFDAVSSILDVCHDVTYEGQAAVELESLAWQGLDADRSPNAALHFAVIESDTGLVLDPTPILAGLLQGLAAQIPAALLARRFHRTLAHGVAEIAERVRAVHGVNVIGLTGGVFLNRLLTLDCREILLAGGFQVLTHRRVPTHDGGLALGQVAVAAAKRLEE